VDFLGAEGASAAMLHFRQLWPLDAAAVRKAVAPNKKRAPKKIFCIEGNATGQFASLLRTVGALSECERVLKYDGLPFTGAEIAERVRHD
jgi:2-oxoglutarate ferredoxin oxidoreductase subunit alpha